MAVNRQSEHASKTEQPTVYRLEKAYEKGNIAQSRELSHFLILCVFLGFLWWSGREVACNLLYIFKPMIAYAAQTACDGLHLKHLLMKSAYATAQACGWFFVLICAVFLLSSGLQTQWRMTPDAIMPKGSRISLGEGLKRLFSSRNSFEFLKGLGKLSVILLIAFFIFREQGISFQVLTHLPPGHILAETSRLISQIFLSLIAAMAILAALDYGYQWFHVFRGLFMSRQDMKDEQKELEGDPSISLRQRQMMRDIANMRNLPEKVPLATVVITNPQHYAVALRWVPSEMSAPKVIAKGMDRVAQRLRFLAKDHFIPLYENPPLARLLYATVKVDQEIFPEQYKAVAEVIRYVLHIQGQNRQKM